jgi:hypothetical protein
MVVLLIYVIVVVVAFVGVILAIRIAFKFIVELSLMPESGAIECPTLHLVATVMIASVAISVFLRRTSSVHFE